MRLHTALLMTAAVGAGTLVGSSSDEAPLRHPATIIRVADGDTVQVQNPDGHVHYIRLIGIDTPETHRPGTPIECGGPEASAELKTLLPKGRPVTYVLDPPGVDLLDKYGRTLAYVYTSPHRLVNTHQLRLGYATVRTFGSHPSKLSYFESVERDAKRRDVGVWKLCNGDFHTPQ